MDWLKLEYQIIVLWGSWCANCGDYDGSSQSASLQNNGWTSGIPRICSERKKKFRDRAWAMLLHLLTAHSLIARLKVNKAQVLIYNFILSKKRNDFDKRLFISENLSIWVLSPLPARGVQQCSLQTHNTVFVDGHAIELALRVACALFHFPTIK